MSLKVELHFTNKWLFTFLVIGLVLVLSFGAWAYDSGSTPDVFGHSAGEVEVAYDGELVTLQEAITQIEGLSVTVDNETCHNMDPIHSRDGGSQNPEKPWDAQCEDNYVMVAIYDDDDNFGDVDNVKCCRLAFE